MNGVSIYVSNDIENEDVIINGERLDLFDDESIEMVLKQTDIRDISTNYSDYSKDFTVPASPRNNKIFKFWYDVFHDNQFSSVSGIPCRIDIDGVFYKKGKIKINSAQRDDGKNYYSIKFSSDLKSLKDRFGDTKIGDLDFSSVLPSDEVDYTDNYIINQIIGSVGVTPIKFPIISTKRILEDFTPLKYVNASTANGIRYDELRPALNFKTIFRAIEEKYNLRFNGNFYNTSTRLDNLYMWMNRNEEPYSAVLRVIDLGGTPTGSTSQAFSFNTTRDYFSIMRVGNATGSIIRYSIQAKFTVNNNTTPYKAFLQQVVLNNDGSVNEIATNLQENNGYVASFENFATGNTTLNFNISAGLMTYNERRYYRLCVESKGNLLITSTYIRLNYIFWNVSQDIENVDATLTSPVINTFTPRFNIRLSLPEMTIYDFFSSVIKMFNLVVLPIQDPITLSSMQSREVYQLETYVDYYSNGNELDITKYTERGQKINKIKTFKKFEFKHSDSEFGLSKLFKESQTPEREYGSFKNEFPLGDDGEYKVESKFHLLIWNQMQNVYETDAYELQNTWITAYSLDDSFEKSVYNKPTIFYYNGESNFLSTSQFMAFTNVNNTSNQIHRYSIFSNVDALNEDFYTTTLTYSTENFFNSAPRTKTLYSNNYQMLINAIYSRYSREYDMQAMLPKSVFSKLTLGSRLIIGNMKYNITDITLNLNTGKTKLKLNNVIEEFDIVETL